MVTVGLNLLTALLEGGAGTPFAHADAIVGVGTSGTTAVVSDTALGSDNSSNACNSGPDSSTCHAEQLASSPLWCTFGSGVANYAWNEWCLATGSGGITTGTHLSAVATGVVMLNHKVSSLGTKASGSWVFVLASIQRPEPLLPS